MCQMQPQPHCLRRGYDKKEAGGVLEPFPWILAVRLRSRRPASAGPSPENGPFYGKDLAVSAVAGSPGKTPAHHFTTFC